MFWIKQLLVWTVILVFIATSTANPISNFQYGRHELLALQTTQDSQPSSALLEQLKWLNDVINTDRTNNESKTGFKKKRGRRGGVRARLKRRGVKTPVPAITFGNVRSLRNKIDELSANCRFLKEYRDSAIIALTETWLEERDSNSTYEIDGFNLVRSDRSNTCKQSGGGLAVYVNEKWCKQVTLRDTHCCDNIEYMTLSCRPIYLPREFCNVFIINVYIPPTADATEASSLLSNCINKIENESPNSLKIILGDFNCCNFKDHIPNYEQFVKCATRDNRILDLLYCNVKDSYRVMKRAPLGNSDHNMLFCMPIYRQKLKREKCKEITVRDWSSDCSELKACFECTDWSVLYDDNCDIDTNVDVFTSYVNFCVDMLIPEKKVCVYPNNKPWVTKQVKGVLNEKRQALCTGDRIRVKEVQKRLKEEISNAKKLYKDKVENLFRSNHSKDAWKGLKLLSGYRTKNVSVSNENIEDYVNELNTFYARFDVHDFKDECDNILLSLNVNEDSPIVISHEDVVKSLKHVKINKARGPDNICARILKSCAEQIAIPLRVLFQASVDKCTVPSLWKVSEIIPVPKLKFPKVNNDFRPVALTSIIMKCFEHIIKNHLCKQIDMFRDPLQFAYCQSRSVQDAGLTLLHEIYSHLEKPNAHVRVLYVDFSSAFNTIQVHSLLRKLLTWNVNSNLIAWIHSYLTNRTQYVKLKNVKSNPIITNTGAPQGCVLSPLLFTLYTNDCSSNYENCSIVKYADDTVIIGKLIGNDTQNYYNQVNNFVEWCNTNYLNLNVKKTKEMIIDFRKNRLDPDHLIINGEVVDRVEEYKYLGIVINDELKWNANTHVTYKKCLGRVQHLRILKNIGVDATIISLFYKSIIESVLNFSLIMVFGSLSGKDKRKLKKIVNISQRLGAVVVPLENLYQKNVINQVKKIMKDDSHPLHQQYKFLPSGRRLCTPLQKTTRYKNSFIPKSVKIFNHMNT